MARVLIEYMGDSIELPFGETIVGRDLSCQIRLNDPSVSRRHVRFVVARDSVTVEDLGSRNGTLLDGAPLKRVAKLTKRAVLLLGNRSLKVAVVTRADAAADGAEDTLRNAESRRGNDDSTITAGVSAVSTVAERVPADVAPPSVRTHNCPHCRSQVAIDADRCTNCGYEWVVGRPHAVTRVHIAVPREMQPPSEAVNTERRAAPRIAVEAAVIYTSESLSFEATARDVSRTGLFIETELLEPVGTQCRITILLDGAPAMAFDAVVSRVVDNPVHGAQPGLGTRFTALSADGERWLHRLIAKLDPTSALA